MTKTAREVIADVGLPTGDGETVSLLGADGAAEVLSSLEEAGFAVVPVEPDKQMLEWGSRAAFNLASEEEAGKIWRSMVAAYGFDVEAEIKKVSAATQQGE